MATLDWEEMKAGIKEFGDRFGDDVEKMLKKVRKKISGKKISSKDLVETKKAVEDVQTPAIRDQFMTADISSPVPPEQQREKVEKEVEAETVLKQEIKKLSPKTDAEEEAMTELERQEEMAEMLKEGSIERETLDHEEAMERKREFQMEMMELEAKLQDDKDKLLLANAIKMRQHGSALEKKDANRRIKLLKKQADREYKIEKMKTDASLGLVKTLVNGVANFTDSNNRYVFAATKALALAEIVVNTMRGIAASNKLGAPQGPILAKIIKYQGIAAGAIVAATAFKGPPKPVAAQKGALIERLPSGPQFGDSVSVMAEPGELMLPRKNAEQAIDDQARRKGYNQIDEDEDDELDREEEIMIGLQPDAADFINIETRRNRALQIGVA